MRARRAAGLRRLGTAAAVQLVGGMQDTVKAGFGRQVNALIGQFRYDLGGRQTGVLRLIAGVQHLPALFGG